MFQGVAAFLEAVDERAEQHARQRAVEAETTALQTEMAVDAESGNGNEVSSVRRMRAAGEEHAPTTLGGNLSLSPLLQQPVAATQCRGDTNPHNSNSNGGTASSSLSATTATASAVVAGDTSISSQGMRNHVEEGAAAATALMFQGGVESALLKRRDEELDALAQDARRHQAMAEAARQELLQRSLQVHQLEESLRTVRARFDEHKAKSRCLLEYKQREYDELHRRLELQEGRTGPTGSGEKDTLNDSDAVVARQREEELESMIASMQQEKERLEAQLAVRHREVDAAHEQRLAIVQQLDFMRLDLRGAQDALESEVAAHQRSKALLQGRQRELNELRAAVEEHGGTFTAAGTLVGLRGNDAESRNEMFFSHQLLEKQNALEAAMRDAAEWRRRCERAAARLEEERTTRVNVTHSQQLMRDAADSRPMFLRHLSSTGRLMSVVVEMMAAVDAAALRFGRLLRRQPVMRLAVVFYVLCLHAWFVMALLMIERAANLSHAANKLH
ncbi:hypothetical protein TraAM80_06367 [Trypanosoma rangeli]|uniref:Golgin-84 n=1 Tax=Trypanosoma rangeli TaxID=5698 RepID=A0A422NAI4_TRYRA|nr:uncharacterized protein TraAM80_06367 [Trypanosoma rangeli]RNF02461.1 hypothetical protein TraAM80_06367 [Trypanosoma rangeli]|eukprot:RNF02461.1 hypothetical protein TraAM80_06367 [Trypanosoma rangeli]